MQDSNYFLTANEVAKMMGLSRARINQLLAENALPYVLVGGVRRVPKEAWERWLQERVDAALAVTKQA